MIAFLVFQKLPIIISEELIDVKSSDKENVNICKIIWIVRAAQEGNLPILAAGS